MRKRSKRYEKAAKLVDPEKRYAVGEAESILHKMESPKIDERVRLSVS